MKSRIVSLIFATALCINAYPQLVMDVAVNAQLEFANLTLKDIHQEQTGQLSKIKQAQIIINAQLDAIHKIEYQYLDYLQTCSNSVENLQQVWDIAEEITALPKNLEELGKAMYNKPTGAMREAAIVLLEAYHKDQTNLITRVPLVIANCKKIISQLVLNGKSAISKDSLNFQFNVEKDPSMSYHKASLLNSYERISLLDQLRSELRNLNWQIRMTTFGVKYATWWGVFRAFDPESYNNFVYGKIIAEEVISTFNFI